MLWGLRKCSLHKPINCHGLSHKYYLLQPTYYPAWVFTKILIILLPKLGHKITLSSHKAQHHSACGKNPKKAQNSKSPTTMWLIPNPTTLRHYLQSPLLHGNTLQNLKIISIKPKFLFGIYFHKAQIPISHLFSQSPNSNLALLYKAQILFWQLSLYSFINPKY